MVITFIVLACPAAYYLTTSHLRLLMVCGKESQTGICRGVSGANLRSKTALTYFSRVEIHWFVRTSKRHTYLVERILSIGNETHARLKVRGIGSPVPARGLIHRFRIAFFPFPFSSVESCTHLALAMENTRDTMGSTVGGEGSLLDGLFYRTWLMTTGRKGIY